MDTNILDGLDDDDMLAAEDAMHQDLDEGFRTQRPRACKSSVGQDAYKEPQFGGQDDSGQYVVSPRSTYAPQGSTAASANAAPATTEAPITQGDASTIADRLDRIQYRCPFIYEEKTLDLMDDDYHLVCHLPKRAIQIYGFIQFVLGVGARAPKKGEYRKQLRIVQDQGFKVGSAPQSSYCESCTSFYCLF